MAVRFETDGFDYGVMAHRKIKYENGKYPLKKLTPGLRFESLLVSKEFPISSAG